MQNTEYKDVFDIGEEALSMENKFSTVSFPSFKNAFTIGENIRGMSNVSPLATVKFFNQSPDDLLTKYYPDSNQPVEGSFTYVPDIGSDLESVITTTVKDFYYYGVEDVNNFAFRVIMFSSTDATKLKESFEVSAPAGREILIFIEDNTEDKASGTYGAIKISNDVLSFLNKSGRLEYDLYNNDAVYEEIKKVIPELSDDQIKTLLQKGYIEDIRIDIAKTYCKLASFFSSGISSVNPGLGILTNDVLRKTTSILLEKVILLIEETKLGENRWQPKPPKLENGEIDKNYTYNPLISSGKDSNGTVNFSEITGLLKTMLTEQDNLVRLVLNIKKDFRKNSQPKGFLELLYNLYLSAYDIMYDVIMGLDDISNLDILKYGMQTYNALLCGVWNGLVDSVSGLFAMVKMIYDGITMGKDFVQNIDKYLPTLLEQFDEAVQAIKKISFTETAQYIYEKLKEINLTFDPVACSYFIGYAFGFIISLIIEIIVGVLISGGTLSVAAIVNALVESILGIFRLGFSAVKGVVKAVRTFVKFVVRSIQDLLKGFQELLLFLKKGWNEIKKIVDDAFNITDLEFKEFRKKKRIELFSTIKGKPINLNLLKKLQKEFENLGGSLLYNDESFEYIASREKAEGVAIEAITFNEELILLNKNATTSAVYEELIHASQYRSGKYDIWVENHGNEIAKNLMEKEAAEELIERAIEWKLPNDEIKLIRERLEFFNEELKILRYEN
ncbi:hypothetical protein MKJ01_02485 [Chryseobacterium sp. SSA4.19]|uniref:hypothetical protein n=1 Tax=Chryseobacterium sp. SSA4.19 TaxID=2919915 RepID=UPI001F4E7C19|nr:hypothetical protein [Chryseobacterium sp. SSA4.19]MCJ8152628.1 hypothetical protein [Chryseobacterium sp. SSA4.19]